VSRCNPTRCARYVAPWSCMLAVGLRPWCAVLCFFRARAATMLTYQRTRAHPFVSVQDGARVLAVSPTRCARCVAPWSCMLAVGLCPWCAVLCFFRARAAVSSVSLWDAPACSANPTCCARCVVHACCWPASLVRVAGFLPCARSGRADSPTRAHTPLHPSKGWRPHVRGAARRAVRVARPHGLACLLAVLPVTLVRCAFLHFFFPCARGGRADPRRMRPLSHRMAPVCSRCSPGAVHGA
jgi:hypothetical protein